jgi:hypothetical protein
MKKIVLSLVLLVSLGTNVYGANCVGLPSESDLKPALIASAGNHAGGLFEGTRMWAAVVNRDGEIWAATQSVFAHPVCLNTWKNGVFNGDEAPATYPFEPPQP